MKLLYLLRAERVISIAALITMVALSALFPVAMVPSWASFLAMIAVVLFADSLIVVIFLSTVGDHYRKNLFVICAIVGLVLLFLVTILFPQVSGWPCFLSSAASIAAVFVID